MLLTAELGPLTGIKVRTKPDIIRPEQVHKLAIQINLIPQAILQTAERLVLFAQLLFQAGNLVPEPLLDLRPAKLHHLIRNATLHRLS